MQGSSAWVNWSLPLFSLVTSGMDLYLRFPICQGRVTVIPLPDCGGRGTPPWALSEHLGSVGCCHGSAYSIVTEKETDVQEFL